MTEIAQHNDSIDVSGIPAEHLSSAKGEISKLIDLAAIVAQKEGKDFLLHSICLTDRFEDEVNLLLQARWDVAPYCARRSHTQAIAKTCWVRNDVGQIRFAVVIDALSVGSCRITNPRFLVTVLHELGHVLREENHLQRLGEEEFTAAATTSERWLTNWAKIIIDEFDVDRLVDSLLGILATSSTGQALSLQNLDEAEGLHWVPALLDALNALPKSIDEAVRGFRTGRATIDDLAGAAIPAVNEVLTLLSHTAARLMSTEHWQDILGEISETEASRRFLRGHLETIVGQLGSREESLEDANTVVSAAIASIFRNCGLRFETVPVGVYIAVDAPAA